MSEKDVRVFRLENKTELIGLKAKEKGFTIGNIIKSPIEGLINYHK